MNREVFKKNPEELQEYLQFRRRGFIVPSKKKNRELNRKVKYKKSLYE